MDPRVLRDRGHWTRTAILALLVQHPGMSRSELGRRLDVTAQAISVQVKSLEEAGLVLEQRPTPLGIDRLAHDAERLHGIASDLEAPMRDLHVISAIASTPIQAGKEVGLWMENGELIADHSKRASHGVAQNDAEPGDEVRVQHPEGVVDLDAGTVEVIRVPSPSRVAMHHISSLPRTDCHVAAVGTRATLLARRDGRLDMRFAGAEAAANAARRGLDVRLYVDDGQLTDALRALQGINVRIVDAPTK